MEVECTLADIVNGFEAAGSIDEDTYLPDSYLPSILDVFDPLDDVLIKSQSQTQSSNYGLDILQILDNMVQDTTVLKLPTQFTQESVSIGDSKCFNNCNSISSTLDHCGYSEHHCLSKKINACDVFKTHRQTFLDTNISSGCNTVETSSIDLESNCDRDVSCKQQRDSKCTRKKINRLHKLCSDNITENETKYLEINSDALSESSRSTLRRKRRRKCQKKVNTKRRRQNSNSRVVSRSMDMSCSSASGDEYQETVSAALDLTNNICSSTSDVSQDDSGFESGDKSNLSLSTFPNSASASSDVTSFSDQDRDIELPAEGSFHASSTRSLRPRSCTQNYNFRLSSIVKRVETEARQQLNEEPKSRPKAPPLSKYRRRTANARERDRMKEMNEAYEHLKTSLPDHLIQDAQEGKQQQNLTKFAILQLALKYISSLRKVLGYNDSPPAGEVPSIDKERAAYHDNLVVLKSSFKAKHGIS
ncbi:hypothetical protein PoB_000883800 [Plakobranchus ocellatus]|uniref:BHLH domain-containing protein n=1 Tax=Plakobranchus ocellatus TaxID=259542 RepID=A0AAV3YIZ1_9GAST|nr:hypothetical protein PoB_000883800 [Plakobranchus ocellatus]